MENSKEELKRHGETVRKLREGMGLDRAQLGKRLGLVGSTVQKVELGHQRLGKPAQRALDALCKGSKGEGGGVLMEMDELRDIGGGYGDNKTLPLKDILRIVMRDDCRSRAVAIARTAECPLEDAMELVLKAELKKGGYRT